MTDSSVFYRRNLPHLHPADSTIFITFRLANSLPGQVLRQLRFERELRRSELSTTLPEDEYRRSVYQLEKQAFGHFDAWLDRCNSGPRWLAVDAAAEIVARELHAPDGEGYRLLAFCIMPNHVHLLVDTAGFASASATNRRGSTVDYPLTDLLRRIKGRSARYCNEALGRSGIFWHPESYDHVVRDPGELERIVEYIVNNPVKAGLVEKWRDWPYSGIYAG
jgi:REP element-mobilizing transposase RayT